MSRQFKNFLAM